MTSGILAVFFALGTPFSPFYGALMKVRRNLYLKGRLFRRFRMNIPVVSIGNLSLGGTGKTPHVLAVAKWCMRQGLSPAIVTRGYGGRAGRGPLVVFDGVDVRAGPDEAGDEPFMMAEILKGPAPFREQTCQAVIVAGSDRVASAALAERHFGSSVILLDDGFQHLRLERDCDVVLLPADRPFGTGRVFPGGDLREPVSSLLHAGVILLTKAEGISPEKRDEMRSEMCGRFPGVPVFFSENRVTGIHDPLRGCKIEAPELGNRKIGAVCAIGSPGAFLETLRRLGLNPVESMTFFDHHRFGPSDFSRIGRMVSAGGLEIVITTQKDMVKLLPFYREAATAGDGCPFRMLYLSMEAEPEEGFWSGLGRILVHGKTGGVTTPRG